MKKSFQLVVHFLTNNYRAFMKNNSCLMHFVYTFLYENICWKRFQVQCRFVIFSDLSIKCIMNMVLQIAIRLVLIQGCLGFHNLCQNLHFWNFISTQYIICKSFESNEEQSMSGVAEVLNCQFTLIVYGKTLKGNMSRFVLI